MFFQALEYKGRNFLDLNNNNNQSIYLTYSKDSAVTIKSLEWVKKRNLV